MPRSMNLNDTAWDILRHRETRDTIRQYDTLWNPLRCNETWGRMEHQGTMHVITIGSSPFIAFDCCLKHSGQKYTESINDLTSLLLFPNYRLKIHLPTSELLPYHCATKSPSSSIACWLASVGLLRMCSFQSQRSRFLLTPQVFSVYATSQKSLNLQVLFTLSWS